MSDSPNMPGIPSGSLPYLAPPMDNPIISQHAVDLLRSMGLWCRIFAVLLFVSAGLMVACGPFALIMGAAGAGAGGRDRPEMLIIGLVYFVMGALYLIPAIYLNRFAGKAKAFALLKDMLDLEAAFAAQKAFWKFTVIMVFIIIGLYLLIIPIIIIGGVMAARP